MLGCLYSIDSLQFMLEYLNCEGLSLNYGLAVVGCLWLAPYYYYLIH